MTTVRSRLRSGLHRRRALLAAHPDPGILIGTDDRARRARRLLLQLLGRPVRCHLCQRELFYVLPFVRDGLVRVPGAGIQPVYVDWATTTALRFRHVELDDCLRKGVGARG